MININLKHSLTLGSILALSSPASVFATNGMFLIAPGTKSRGMGGVSIAMTHDTLSSAINPATMAHTGNRFDMGGDIFAPTAKASLGTEGVDRITVESKPDHVTIADGVYIMPNLGASWNDGDISYGFTMVGVGGGGSRYEPNLYNNITGGDPDLKLGVSLLVMQINPTIAMKLDENNSVGATLIIGMQVFKSYGLDEFVAFTPSQTPDYLSNQGADIAYGAGIRLGWLGEFMNDDLTLGAAYSSQTYMTKFDKYKELFAEQGQFNTPGNIGIGMAYKVKDDLTIAVDINYIMYEDVAAVSNLGPNVTGNVFQVDKATNGLGEDDGLGFGWTNQTVYKLGAMYDYNDTWTLRGGWNYGKSPINEQREIIFNIAAPATVQHHLTMGATYKYNTDIELSFSYVHAFEFKQNGPTYIGSTGEIGMSQDSVGATFSMNF